jgi:energy-coupling factor transport system ATP-binding protein
MIDLQDVRFTYPDGVQALQGINLQVPDGDRIALVGENGAGKTTLAKHLNGLLKPTRGRVVVEGHDTRSQSTASLARVVSFVFQNPDEQLFLGSVYDEIAFGAKNLGYSGKALEKLIQSALVATGLQSKAGWHPYDLIPSDRKLLGLASIHSMNTPIIVLDEPTIGLDHNDISRVASILHTWFRQGRTVIIISHNLDFCAEHLTRFVVMGQGQIHADGPVEEVFWDDDLLARCGLEPPQLVRLAKALGFRRRPSNIEGFLAAFREQKTRPT